MSKENPILLVVNEKPSGGTHTDVVALQSPDGSMITYNPDSMAVHYQAVLDALLQPEKLSSETDAQYAARQKKGKLLKETMQGEHLQEDFQQISRALGFLMDHVEKIATGGDEFFLKEPLSSQDTEERRVAYRTEIRDLLYEYRDNFFPRAMQALSDAEMKNFVTGQHKGRDPLLHTCEAMASLAIEIGLYQRGSGNNDKINIDIIALELSAIMLHDFGKLHDPRDATHAVGSVFWADQWINGLAAKLISSSSLVQLKLLPFARPESRQKFLLDEQEKIDKAGFFLRFLIKFHDLGGFIGDKSGDGKKSKLLMQDALAWILSEKYVPSREAMYALYAIQEADMDAIPGINPRFVLENRHNLLELIMRLDRLKSLFPGLEEDLLTVISNAADIEQTEIAPLMKKDAMAPL